MAWYMDTYILTLLLAMLMAIGVGIYTWSKRPRPGMVPMTLLMALVAFWCMGYMLELGLEGLDQKVFWAKMQYVGIAMIPFFWLVTALEYTDQRKDIPYSHLAYLLVIPAVTISLVMTNEHHHLIWTSTTLRAEAASTLVTYEYGSYFWVNMVYSYVLLFLGTVLIVRRLLRRKDLFRAQGIALLIGVIVPWTANASFIIDIPLLGDHDPTPIVFSITGLSIGWGLARYKLFDLRPVAHDKVFEFMADGVVVCDDDLRVVDMNPKAEEMLGKKSTAVVGSSALILIPRLGQITREKGDDPETRAEIVVGEKEKMHLDLRLSTFKDQDGVAQGHVVILHDITPLKAVERRLRQKHIDLRLRVEEADLDLANSIMALSDEVHMRRKTEEEVKRRLRFERTVSSIFSMFLGTTDLDKAIHAALGEMSKLSDANRTYLFLFDETGTRMSNTHEWCDKGVTSLKERLQDLPVERFPWWTDRLLENEVLHIADVDALPPQADTIRTFLKGNDVRSLLILPVKEGKRLVGFVGLDNIMHTGGWTEDEIALMRLVSFIIGTALERKRVEDIIKERARDRLIYLLASALPVFTPQMSSKARDMLVSTFATRFENHMRPMFMKDIGSLAEHDHMYRTPDIMISLYLEWLVELFQGYGIKVEALHRNGTRGMTFHSCPWTEDAKGNPIFCLICRTMVYRSFQWTGLKGEAKQSTSIAGGSRTCQFHFSVV